MLYVGALRQVCCLFHKSQCYILNLLCNAVYHCKILKQISSGAPIWHQNRKKTMPYQLKLYRRVSDSSLARHEARWFLRDCPNIKTSRVPGAASLARQVNSHSQVISRTSEDKPACRQPERLWSGQTCQVYPRAAMGKTTKQHINQSYSKESLEQSRNPVFTTNPVKKPTSLF